jgi:hypothetical protein
MHSFRPPAWRRRRCRRGAGRPDRRVLLRDHLSFEALRDNREALLAFRDAITSGPRWPSCWPMSRSSRFRCPARRRQR